MAGGGTGILLTLASEGGFGEPLQGLASLGRGALLVWESDEDKGACSQLDSLPWLRVGMQVTRECTGLGW